MSSGEPYPIEPVSDPNSLYPYEYDLQWEVPKTGGTAIEEYEFKIRKVSLAAYYYIDKCFVLIANSDMIHLIVLFGYLYILKLFFTK